MNLWKNLKNRQKLVKCFKKASLFLGTTDRPILPKIRSITTEMIVFTLPTGLDPSLIGKNLFVFKQIYGEHIEIKGDIQTFTLSLSKMPVELQYDIQTFNLDEYKLPVVAGIDKNGKMIIYDMLKYPHLRIAGETGSGKSTQPRSILTTLIQALSPKILQLYLCDLKRSEFHLYRNIKHVQGPFTTAHELLPVLRKIRLEMQHRGELLDAHEIAHIDDLPDTIPYIVLCIDEVALLQKEKEIMECIEEISAIGRALGVFLILSMQRPDSKVLDGKLKVNLTVRMGFKTADRINSRIMGTMGSEKLKKEGTFLLKLPIFNNPTEILAPFLPLDKAKKLLAPYKSKKFNKSNTEKIVDLHEVHKEVFGVLDK